MPSIERGVISGFDLFLLVYSILASSGYIISTGVGHRVVTGVTVTPQLDL